MLLGVSSIDKVMPFSIEETSARKVSASFLN